MEQAKKFSDNFLAFSIVLMAISLFCVAGFLFSNYVKVSQYVCYYGVDNTNAVGGVLSNGVMDKGSVWDPENGKVVSLNNIRCIRNDTEKNFTCPPKYETSKFLGYETVPETEVKKILLES